MAELNQVLKILTKHLRLIVVLTLLGGFLGFGYTYIGGEKYEALSTIYIKRAADQNANSYYSYDGYYAQQVSKEYTDTVLGLLKTIDPYREAASRISNYSPSEIFGLTKAKKVSSQVIELRVRNKDEFEAKKVLTALVDGLTAKISELNQTGDRKISIESVSSQPLTQLNKNQTLINVSIGFLSGLVIALFSLSLSYYFKPS